MPRPVDIAQLAALFRRMEQRTRDEARRSSGEIDAALSAVASVLDEIAYDLEVYPHNGAWLDKR